MQENKIQAYEGEETEPIEYFNYREYPQSGEQLVLLFVRIFDVISHKLKAKTFGIINDFWALTAVVGAACAFWAFSVGGIWVKIQANNTEGLGVVETQMSILPLTLESKKPISQKKQENLSFNLAPADVSELPEPNVNEFIEKWTEIAVKSCDGFGFPPSVKMAQGIIESRCGCSILAQPKSFSTRDKNGILRQGNYNFFGIKCHRKVGECKVGHCSNHMDDYSKDFFIVFSKVEDSWYEHSKFLKKNGYLETPTDEPSLTGFST